MATKHNEFIEDSNKLYQQLYDFGVRKAGEQATIALNAYETKWKKYVRLWKKNQLKLRVKTTRINWKSCMLI